MFAIFICDIVAQHCNTCDAGVMVSFISHRWPVYVSGECLRPFCDKSLLSIAFVACGVVVRNRGCEIDEVFILEALAKKRGVRELFGRVQIERDLVVVQSQ